MNRKDLLTYYLSNEKCLEALPENERLLEEVDLVLELYGESSKNDFDIEKDWEDLRLRIQAEKEKAEINKTRLKLNKKYLSPPVFKPWNHRGMLKVLSLAAVFLVIIMTGAVTLYLNNVETATQAEKEQVFQEVKLDKGQRGRMILSDGTNLNINADTRIELPKVFASDKREVYLHEGEAYFDVAKDPDRPFLIHSGGAVIRVLGTSFTVRSYPEDDGLRVAVKEGTVMLETDHDKEPGLTLETEQLGFYSFSDKKLSAYDIEDIELFTSWTEGFLKFKDTPLQEVALQLERRYDVKINFSTSDLQSLRLTAELKSRSMMNVLNVLSASLGISYIEEDWQTITFTKRVNAS